MKGLASRLISFFVVLTAFILGVAVGYHGAREKANFSSAKFPPGADHSLPNPVLCPPTSTDLMVILTAGQSNAANHGEGRYTAGRQVVQFHEGKCYPAADPLLGASGSGGSVWGRVADGLVAADLARNVLIVAAGVEGTPVQRWSPKGDLYPMLVRAARSLDAAGYRITHVLWHQGESNHRTLLQTSREEYMRYFLAMLDGLRAAGVDAPIYVAVASRCVAEGPDPEIAAAQAELGRLRPDIRPGPDTDALAGPAFRHDGCHFSEAGLERHAELWVKALGKRR